MAFSFSCVRQQNQVLSDQIQHSQTAININTAAQDELEKLPGIGKDAARRIIEHREKYGRFQRLEELLLLRGISEKTFRDVRPLIKVE